MRLLPLAAVCYDAVRTFRSFYTKESVPTWVDLGDEDKAVFEKKIVKVLNKQRYGAALYMDVLDDPTSVWDDMTYIDRTSFDIILQLCAGFANNVCDPNDLKIIFPEDYEDYDEPGRTKS